MQELEQQRKTAFGAAAEATPHNGLLNAVKPPREAVPKSPEKLSDIEKALNNFAAELANFTEMREGIEHLFSTKAVTDDAFHSEVVSYFNSLKKSFKEFSDKFNREIDYSRELEEKVKNKELERQVSILEKELLEERAKTTLFMDQISAQMRDCVQTVSDKCAELKSADALINESIMKFRTETYQQAESEYRQLKQNCETVMREFSENAQKTLEALKTHSVSFLRQCEAENKELVKKIPSVETKVGVGQWITIALGCLGILSLLARFFAG